MVSETSQSEPATLTPQSARAYQFIYRQELTGPIEVEPRADVSFVYCRRPLAAAHLVGPLARQAGLPAAIRSLIKLTTPRRELYGLLRDDVLVHQGWVMHGRCRHYNIEPTSAIIGPIVTHEQSRGQGYGTYATRLALAELQRAGVPVVYIDTSEHNLACQKMVAKCGFGPPAAMTFRPADGD